MFMMTNETLNKFSEYINKNGSRDNNEYMRIENQKAEKLLFNTLEKNDFFSKITLIKAVDIANNYAFCDLPIASITDTTSKITEEGTEQAERTPKNVALPLTPYHCEQINLDSYLSYADIDKYAQSDLETELHAKLGGAMVQNILMLGLNGEQRSETSNHNTNPLGQDVKKGWIKQIKEQGRTLTATIGENGDYKTAHKAIKRALAQIADFQANNGELIAICGSEVLEDYPINASLDMLKPNPLRFITLTQKQLGGLMAISLPFMPANGVLITTLENLVLWLKLDSTRLFFTDVPQKNMYESYFSTCLDFGVKNPSYAMYLTLNFE